MGSGDSERGQMAASLRWYTESNAESHGNSNGYCNGNTYRYGNGNTYSYCNTYSYANGYTYSYANTCSTERSEQSQRIRGFKPSNQPTLDR